MNALETVAQATIRLAICIPNDRLSRLLGEFDDWAVAMMAGRLSDGLVDELQGYLRSMRGRFVEEAEFLRRVDFAGEEGRRGFDRAALCVAETLEENANALGPGPRDRGAAPLRFTHFADRAARHSDIGARLQSVVELRWDAASLPREARAFGAALVDLCCYALVPWVRNIPPVADSDLWTATIRSAKLAVVSHGAFTETRRTGSGSGTGTDIRRLGVAQRRDVTLALGRMELFGLPFDARFRSVPLEISYLTARLVRSKGGASEPTGLDQLVRRGDRPGGPPVRSLIVGRAGSGKTTAAQWLACKGAQGLLHELQDDSRDLFPAFVRLRDVAGPGRTVDDRALVLSEHQRSHLDPIWYSTANADLHLLVILDGWDEVPVENRPQVLSWLDSIVTRFPDTHVVVTSRPEGAASGDFARRSFERFEMALLEPAHARQMVGRWFDGLLENLQVNSVVDVDPIRAAREELIEDLATPELSSMCDSPLVTSMLCCLYANTRTRAPNKRGELYELVINALLHQRDRDRGVFSEWNRFELDEKLELVRAIARRMSLGGRRELPVSGAPGSLDSIRAVVGEVLPLVSRMRESVTTVTHALLERSTVLHLVAENDAEFIHGSIQDCLTAMGFRGDGDATSLKRLAEQGQMSVLSFACYRAPRALCDNIVQSLVERAENGKRAARRPEPSVLLAIIECVSASTVISPELRARARLAVSSLFPPASETDARLVAGLGDAAIGFLTVEWVRETGGQHRHCIDALSRIGSGAALDAMAVYARTAGSQDGRALIEAWHRSDRPDVFAADVLALIPGRIDLDVSDEARLRSALALPNVRGLRIAGLSLRRLELEATEPPVGLHRLQISGCSDLADLQWTTRLLRLRRLSVTGVHGLDEVGAAGPVDLLTFQLERVVAKDVDWETCLGRLTALRSLSLSQVRLYDGPVDLLPSTLTGLRSLTRFSCGDQVRLETLGVLGHDLRDLALGWDLSEDDVRHVADNPRLESLRIRISDPSLLPFLYGLSVMRSLCLDRSAPSTVTGLGRLDGLEDLTVISMQVGAIWTARLPSTLRSVTLVGCDGNQRGAPASGHSSGAVGQVRRVSWTGGELDDLEWLHRLPHLEELEIRDVTMASLDGVQSVPDGCRVIIVGTPPDLDEAPLRQLESRRACSVSYEPATDFMDWDQAVS